MPAPSLQDLVTAQMSDINCGRGVQSALRERCEASWNDIWSSLYHPASACYQTMIHTALYAKSHTQRKHYHCRKCIIFAAKMLESGGDEIYFSLFFTFAKSSLRPDRPSDHPSLSCVNLIMMMESGVDTHTHTSVSPISEREGRKVFSPAKNEAVLPPFPLQLQFSVLTTRSRTTPCKTVCAMPRRASL